jgi:hypothetical protein
MIFPFQAAYYSKENRKSLSSLAVADLDTAEHLWGATDSSLAFRNVLVGSAEHRGEMWQAWIAGQQIELADTTAFYVLNQKHIEGSKSVDRWAIFATIELSSNLIYVHENVFPEGVERARQSTEVCEGDMAPIFVGCSDDLGRSLRDFLKNWVIDKKLLLEMQGTDEYRIWQMEDPAAERELQTMFRNRGLYLLDGHHRLAAARENQRLGIGDGRILSCICSMEKEDTLILPIHRIVHCDRWILQDAFLGDLIRAGCKVIDRPDLRPQDIAKKLELISSSELLAFALHAHSDRVMEVKFPQQQNLPEALASLSVAALDFGILPSVDKLTTIPVSDPRMALEQLALDQAQVGFFLPPVTAAQVRTVARAGLKMPRKSTRFTPKPALGLIMRPWN